MSAADSVGIAVFIMMVVFLALIGLYFCIQLFTKLIVYTLGKMESAPRK